MDNRDTLNADENNRRMRVNRAMYYWRIGKKGKLGANAMKRVAADAHLLSLFEPAKRPDDRAVLQFPSPVEAPGTRFYTPFKLYIASVSNRGGVSLDNPADESDEARGTFFSLSEKKTGG